MAAQIRAVDVSAFQGELDDQEWWNALAREGVNLLIAQGHGGLPGGGVGVNPHVRTHLRHARAAGMRLALYSWPGDKWREAVEAAGGFAQELLFVGLDVERDARLEGRVADEVRRAGRHAVVYTGEGEWAATMGAGTTSLRDEWLWDARYRFSNKAYMDCTWPDDDEVALQFVSYGGWSRRIGWQAMGTVTFNGSAVDLSLIDAAWLDSLDPRRGPTANEDTTELLGWLRENRGALAALTAMVSGAGIGEPVPDSDGEDPRSRAIRRGTRLLQALAALSQDVEPEALRGLVRELSGPVTQGSGTPPG
jgi:hypothetical protein